MKKIVLVVATLIVFILGFGFRDEVVYLANTLNIGDFLSQKADPEEREDDDSAGKGQSDENTGGAVTPDEASSSDDQAAGNQESDEQSGSGSSSQAADDSPAGEQPSGDANESPAMQPSASQPSQGNSSSRSEANAPKNHQEDTDFLILVNKQVKLPADYVPKNLVIPNIPFPFSGTHEKMYMQADAASALEKLFAEARKENIYLYGLSGYRSYQTQKSIFAYNVQRFGSEAEANKISARAGESEHQTGLAMDITSKRVNYELVTAFGDTPEGKWVRDNAHKFGFIIRYPQGKEDITGYIYEPWHLRYVGVEHATEIYNQGITLEEYLQGKNQ